MIESPHVVSPSPTTCVEFASSTKRDSPPISARTLGASTGGVQVSNSPPSTSTGKFAGKRLSSLVVGGWASVGLGQPMHTEYASVFWFCAIHSVPLNALNVDAGSPASSVRNSLARTTLLAFMLNSCGSRDTRLRHTARPIIRRPEGGSSPRLRIRAGRRAAAAGRGRVLLGSEVRAQR